MSATIKSALTEATASLEDGRRRRLAESGESAAHARTRSRPHLPPGAPGRRVYRPNSLISFRHSSLAGAEGDPLQYIIGHQEFFQLEFEVTPDVLIPRPETELIVEVGIEILKDEAAPVFATWAPARGQLRFLCFRNCHGRRPSPLMFRPAALEVAERNAERHGVTDRLQLVQSDLFSTMDPAAAFDLIVSNPPYVPASDLNGLQREVRHEPPGRAGRRSRTD